MLYTLLLLNANYNTLGIGTETIFFLIPNCVTQKSTIPINGIKLYSLFSRIDKIIDVFIYLFLKTVLNYNDWNKSELGQVYNIFDLRELTFVIFFFFIIKLITFTNINQFQSIFLHLS